MLNATVYNLGDATIASAVTDLVITSGVSSAGVAQSLIDRLDGMSSLTLVAAFTYGSGGTAAILIVETALGAGGVWLPIARFDFATASLAQDYVLTRNADVTSPRTIAALGSASAIAGRLGDRLRARLTTTGAYVDTLLSVRASIS